MTTMEGFVAVAVSMLVCLVAWSRLAATLMKRFDIVHRERCLSYLTSRGYEAKPYRPQHGVSDVRLRSAIWLLAQEGCLIHDASGRIVGLEARVVPRAPKIRLVVSNADVTLPNRHGDRGPQEGDTSSIGSP